MKIRKILLFSLILLGSLSANAQIENEIRSFVDSTETIINNGKRLLASEVRTMNYEKAIEIYNYLNQKTKPDNCSAFSYNEHLLIALITSDWDTFLTKAEEYRKNIYPCHPNTHSIQRELSEEFFKFNDMFYQNALDAGLNSEDSDLIELFYLSLNRQEESDKYEEEYRLFKKKYPQTRYVDFLKHYLPVPQISMAMIFSFGASAIFPQGNLGSNFTYGVNPAMDIAFTYQKWYFGLSVSTASIRSKYSFDTQTDRYETISFYPDDKFNFEIVGFKGGYSLLQSNWFKLTPFVELGGASLTSNIYPAPKNNNDEVRLFRSFYTGPGMIAEIKLAQFKGRNTYDWNATPPSYLSLRLDGGYNLITNQKFDMLKGDAPYVSLKLTWAMGNFNR